MGRLHSFYGCMPCKRRRKKCGEEKPICATCIRLKLDCSYDASQRKGPSLVHLGTFEVAPPSISPLATNCSKFSSEREKVVMLTVPNATLSFFSPICQPASRDLTVLWQMMAGDELVRSALVACFSVLPGPGPESGTLDNTSYCHALKILQKRINNLPRDASGILILQASITFLGLMGSTGHESTIDPLQHWKAIVKLFGLVRPSDTRSMSLAQRNLYILVLEATVYHLSCRALFSANLESLWAVYRESYIFELLAEINPPDLNCPERSLLLCGQYTVYYIMLEVTYRQRRPGRQRTTKTRIDDMEDEVRVLEANLFEALGQSPNATCLTVRQMAALDIYRMFLGALTICITALRDPSGETGQKIDDLASENLDTFIHLPLFVMNHAPTTWPLFILTCAIRDEQLFRRFLDQVSKLEAFLDPGHMKLLRDVIKESQKLRDGKSIVPEDWSEEEACYLPIGLSLLRKSGGILS